MPELPIDRQALVERHRVVLREPDPRSPLTVGNGEFCFTADLTGLQSFPDHYPVGPRDPGAVAGTLLGTMSQWGWHSTPTDEAYVIDDAMITYETPRGPVRYVDQSGSIEGGTELGTNERDLWLRANPHRLHLGLIGLVRTDRDEGAIQPDELADAEQRLDLWRGELRSTFSLDGHAVSVITVCDPERDLVAFRIESSALAAGLLAIKIDFPYGSEDWHRSADWTAEDRHTTELEPADDGWVVGRTVDDTTYQVRLAATPGAKLRRTGAQGLRVDPGPAKVFEVRAWFAREAVPAPPTVDEVADRAARWWAGFWSGGAAVQLAGTDDPRAAELERRIVLSQYLTAINAGSAPPAETGLICNSWRGKIHLEMHWWHSAHFAHWNRPELLLRSLRWYHDALPSARAIAAGQGYRGARWPKQVGPDVREAPSSIGPFLVWQQPHPIHLAELAYRSAADPASRLGRAADRAVLEEFADIVFASADFMADLAVPTDRGYELGPPLIPAQESYGGIRTEVWNPTYELVYWHWALDVACRWRERLGLPVPPVWREVSERMIPPAPRAGSYPAIQVEPYTIRTDHPSMLCALGVLPQTTKIDPDVMNATLDDVLADWDWSSTWGWDYPVIAMCAARLGRPETAVDALLADQHKNEVLPNGHNRQTASLPLYLPGNGGLLAAVALMGGGWEDGPERAAPGFPADWLVEVEGLLRGF